ncbi:hypothetical protein ACXC9Q_26755 [Kribbella sp. CWNU-51]
MTDGRTHDVPLGTLGPEILPGTWEHGWVAGVVRAVERRTGVPSRWNGRLYEEPNSLFLATAHEDGAMSVSRALILEPAQWAHTADRPLTYDENAAARRAVVTVAHEAKHLANDLGDDSVPGAVKRGSNADRALEEGLVDTWSHRNGDAVIMDVGMDQVAPGVLKVRFAASYPGFMKATDGVLHGLSECTGLPPDEIRAAVDRTERPQRYNAMADLVLRHRLGELVPAAHRVQLQYRLGAPLERQLGGMTDLEYSGAFDAATLAGIGAQTAQQAVDELGVQIGAIEAHYRTWHEQNPGAVAEPPRMRMSRGELIRIRQEAARAQSATEPEPSTGGEMSTGDGRAGGGAGAGGGTAAGGAAASGAEAAAPVDSELMDLQRFLGSHTSAVRPVVPAVSADQLPDNVRRLDARRGPGRGE